MALDLGKQVGPLPLGAWLAVVGTGLGIAYYTRNSGGGGTTVTRDTTTDPLTGEDATGTGPGWVAVPPPSSAPTGDAPPQDNDEWGRLAINYLIAQGYDPALSQSAIGKALQGTKMSVREWTLWGIALRHMGAPPFAVDVVPPVSTPGPVTPPSAHPPAPTPAPPKPGTRFRYYTVRPGDSLSKISRKYYHDVSKWHRIYDANRAGHRRADGHMGMIHNPNVIRVGWRLLIP